MVNDFIDRSQRTLLGYIPLFSVRDVCNPFFSLYSDHFSLLVCWSPLAFKKVVFLLIAEYFNIYPLYLWSVIIRSIFLLVLLFILNHSMNKIILFKEIFIGLWASTIPQYILSRYHFLILWQLLFHLNDMDAFRFFFCASTMLTFIDLFFNLLFDLNHSAIFDILQRLIHHELQLLDLLLLIVCLNQPLITCFFFFFAFLDRLGFLLRFMTEFDWAQPADYFTREVFDTWRLMWLLWNRG